MRWTTTIEVQGPWSLSTSRTFWEGFTPTAIASEDSEFLHAVFLCETDWAPVAATISQRAESAIITVEGDGDLESAAEQVGRFLSIDVDGRGWPEVARRDAIVADAQEKLPGLRPCGFYSPFEAAAWSVLSQRIRMVQAARLRRDLIAAIGVDGAFPSPVALLDATIDLPGRKPDYLRAVAEAALAGQLDGVALRALDPVDAMTQVERIIGIGPFGAELIVLRGANVPDGIPHTERRLEAEIVTRYGEGATLDKVSENWRPYRTWASVYLRALRERRISASSAEG